MNMSANKILPGLGVHHLALRSSDFTRTLTFYEALGCRVVAAWNEAPKRIAMLDLGDDCRVEVFEGATEGKRDITGSAGEWFHFALRDDDPDLAYATAIAAGATSITAPKDVTLNSDPVMYVRLAFVAGPDGEVLEFFRQK